MASSPVEMIHPTFLGLASEESAYAAAGVVLVRAPYDGTTSYVAGARNGPDAIVAASSQVELFDHELGSEVWRVGIHTLPSFLPDSSGPGAVVEQVYALCKGPVDEGKLCFLLGGEHSVSTGNARACVERHGEVSFLQIDAHFDLRHSYQGSRFNHACVARRLLEWGRVVHVGVRTACPEELKVVEDHHLAPIWGHEIAEEPQDVWIERALTQLGSKVYVTVDVDGLDPSVIPSTGTPVPGGLSWYQTLALLRRVGLEREIVGCDLVELAPQADDHRSAFAAALLAYKMIGYFTDGQ
ncbi:MAG: agmatinase [Deltaproteobacteria bacterium]|nr:agmatinase [Deltaproteobacteria bacterium]